MKKIIVTTSWDDGHKLDIRLAELLKKYNIQGTFYVTSKNREKKKEDILSEEQIALLSKSVEIGAHTMTHGLLTHLSDKTARSEINDSKKYLEKITGKTISTFCYPRGSYYHKHVKMVHEAGFAYARTVKRHSFGTQGFPFEAQTTIHTYNHWSDLWKIARFVNFNPLKIFKYFQWDELAKAMFDRVCKTGGVFHLWGHSWEIDGHNDWERLEDVLRYIAHKKDVQYLTNGELASVQQNKILIAAPYFPPHLGGTEFYAYNIAKGLQKDFGWDVCIATTGNRGFRVVEENYKGFKVYKLPYWFKLSNTPVNLFWPISFKRILKKENISLINAHAPVPLFADMIIWAKKSIPAVLTYHGLSMKKNKLALDWIIDFYERFILSRTLKRASSIVCASDAVHRNFSHVVADNIDTITPGVDLKYFIPTDCQNKNTILFVGGVNKSDSHKGLKYLLEAMVSVAQKHSQTKLIVVGAGENRDYFEMLAKNLGIARSVDFVGGRYGEELRDSYKDASIFVLPSLNDNHPLVILEAMACGLPVVSTTVGNIPAIVEDGKTGFLVAPGDSNALAKKVIHLLDNPEQSKTLGSAGREKVSREFDWGTRVEDYDRLFKMAINGDTKKASCMTVAQIVGYYPPHMGGMEVVAKEISLELARKNYSVTVFTSDIDAEKTPKNDIRENYSVKRLKSFEFAHTPIIWSLPFRLFRLPRGSVLHLHIAQAGIPEIVFLIAKLRRFPFIAHFHLDVGKSGSFGWLLPFYKKYLLGFVLRRADKVIVFSEEQSHLVRKKYEVIESKIAVVPNGVGKEFFFRDVRSLPKDSLKLLYVGRLSVQKRLDRLVDALSLLKVPVHLTVVGDGEEKAVLESRVKKLGIASVSFEGKKYGAGLLEYYRKADVFVIASDIEGMPLVVLEAMASGLPIVASDVVGLKELVRGVGILVEKPSAENFAEALTDIWYNSEQLKDLSIQSLDKAEQYSWAKLVEKMEVIYREIS